MVVADAKLPRPSFGHKFCQVALRNVFLPTNDFVLRLTESLGLDLHGALLKNIVQVSESFGII